MFMKAVKVLTIVAAVFILTLGLSGMAQAFHSGGVAECEGCHSMHSPDPGGSFLLVGDTASSTCLSCHGKSGASSYHIATPPGELGPGTAPGNITPGGDFSWLSKTYEFVIRGNLTTEEGNTHGHDINAGSYATWGDDSNNTNAPGGTFPQSQLACNSCHDPHGKYRRIQGNTIVTAGYPTKASGSYPGAGNEPTATEAVGAYRILAGAGYTKDGVTFPGVPAAKVPSTYNRSEATTQTRVAYGKATTGGQVAWGTWCATCHPDMHSNGNYVHPTDEAVGSDIRQNYEQYVKSGDMTGSAGSSFLSLVPFVTASADYAGVLAPLAVNNDSQLGGPGNLDEVSCVTCHRAHASGFEFALRWGYQNEFMTKESQYTYDSNIGRGRTEAEMTIAYGGRPATRWATYQRVLCNKCHAQD